MCHLWFPSGYNVSVLVIRWKQCVIIGVQVVKFGCQVVTVFQFWCQKWLQTFQFWCQSCYNVSTLVTSSQCFNYGGKVVTMFQCPLPVWKVVGNKSCLRMINLHLLHSCLMFSIEGIEHDSFELVYSCHQGEITYSKPIYYQYHIHVSL